MQPHTSMSFVLNQELLREAQKDLLSRRAIVELSEDMIFREIFKGCCPQRLNLLAAYYSPEMFCFELVVCGPDLEPVKDSQPAPRLAVYYYRQTLACGCTATRATRSREEAQSWKPVDDPFGQLLQGWDRLADLGESNYATCARELRGLLSRLQLDERPTS